MIYFFRYLIISTVCLSICYVIYLYLFRKESGFSYLRAYLLFSIFISLLLPLTPLHIETGIVSQGTHRSEQVAQISHTNSESIEVSSFQGDDALIRNTSGLEFTHLLKLVYLFGVVIVLLWIFQQLFHIVKLVFGARVKKSNGIYFATSKKVRAPFSFFTWIFLPEAIQDTDEANIIIRHEKIHVSGLHSLDMLLANLLCAFMWFNPLIWRLRYSLQQLHEYLADEGTLSSGIDRKVYMELMLDQAAEKRLIPLYSGFNRSLLKNRMLMMTKMDTYKRNNYKILVLFPLLILLMLAVACVNGSKGSNEVADENITLAVEAVKMNVVYCGVDNPVIIAANGIDMNHIEVEIDNGKIIKEGKEYIIHPARTGHARVDILQDGVKIGSKDFRVLAIPDPRPYLVLQNGKVANYEVKITDLVDAKVIMAELPDFLFDVDYKIIGFQISANFNGITTVALSDNGAFSDEQRDMMKRLKQGQTLNIGEIKAIGPDGTTRLLNPLEIKIL